MSYQKKFESVNYLTYLGVLFSVSFIILSCNPKKNASDATTSATNASSAQVPASNSSVGKKAVPFTSVTVPVFRIEAANLRDLYNNKTFKKLIVKIGINDFADLSTIEMIAYGAKNQTHHGKGETPIQNISTQGTTTINSPFILGNNYIDLKAIVKKLDGSDRDFTYLLLEPKNGEGTNANHLVFHIKVVKEDDKKNVLSETPLGDSNPSPPADPGS